MTTTQNNIVETLTHAKLACWEKYMEAVDFGMTVTAQMWWDRYQSYAQQLAEL